MRQRQTANMYTVADTNGMYHINDYVHSFLRLKLCLSQALHKRQESISLPYLRDAYRSLIYYDIDNL
jgi:hypothetical protein